MFDSDDDSPLPSIYFSQYVGCNFCSNKYNLKKGKNILTIPFLSLDGIKEKIKPRRANLLWKKI